MTDAAYLLEILSDGEPHSQAELLSRSFTDRGHGLTIHSRVADLRKQGHVIVCERVPGESRGRGWTYQLLVSLDESPQSDPAALLAEQEARACTAGRTEAGRGDSSSELTLFDAMRKPAWS